MSDSEIEKSFQSSVYLCFNSPNEDFEFLGLSFTEEHIDEAFFAYVELQEKFKHSNLVMNIRQISGNKVNLVFIGDIDSTILLIKDIRVKLTDLHTFMNSNPQNQKCFFVLFRHKVDGLDFALSNEKHYGDVDFKLIKLQSWTFTPIGA